MGVRCGGRAGARGGRRTLRLHIIAYGKAGRSPEAELADRYCRRIAWPIGLTELGDSAPVPPPAAGAVEILLDERGEALSSEAFAAMLARLRDEGTREARFLIGPADGHSATTRTRAARAISFGPATWPHLLVRAMLAEQLYRAVSILAGHPYHRA